LSCDRCNDNGVLSSPDGRTLYPCACVPREKRWRAAGIPPKYSATPIAPAEVVFGDGRRARSRFIWGPVGTRKTSTAVEALKGFLEVRHGGLFVDLPQLEMRRRTDWEVGGEFARAPFLVADDLGWQNRMTQFWEDFLGDLIRYRYNEDLPTIFTSNHSLEELEGRLGSAGESLVSRIFEMVGGRVEHRTGPDQRVVNARKEART